MADNDPANDGTDTDSDGACDAGDTDDDNDGVIGNDVDTTRWIRSVCEDADNATAVTIARSATTASGPNAGQRSRPTTGPTPTATAPATRATATTTTTAWLDGADSDPLNADRLRGRRRRQLRRLFTVGVGRLWARWPTTIRQQ